MYNNFLPSVSYWTAKYSNRYLFFEGTWLPIGMEHQRIEKNWIYTKCRVLSSENLIELCIENVFCMNNSQIELVHPTNNEFHEKNCGNESFLVLTRNKMKKYIFPTGTNRSGLEMIFKWPWNFQGHIFYQTIACLLRNLYCKKCQMDLRRKT